MMNKNNRLRSDEGSRHPPSWRRCLLTRQSHPRTALIRFVIAPDGCLVPDIAEKLPGRGFWITATTQAMRTAIARNLFARAAGCSVRMPEEDIVCKIAAMYARRMYDLLGLAKRAGLVIPGIPNVRQAVSALRTANNTCADKKIAFALLSHDAGRDAQGRASDMPVDVPVLSVPLTTYDLGHALGLAGVSLVGLHPDKLTEMLKNTVMRWHALQNNDSESSACTTVVPLHEKDLIVAHD